MKPTPGPEGVTGLEARYAALRQAARSPGAEPADMLEAAFTELEGYETHAPLVERQSVIIEVAPTRTFSWGL